MSNRRVATAERRPDTARRSGRRKLIGQVGATVIVIVATLAVVTGFSTAIFSDSETSAGSSFSSGTIIIDGTPNSAAFNLPTMYPGDEAVMELTATNVGSDTLRYAITSTTTEDTLASELTLTVRQGVTTCDVASWSASGVQLYQGVLGDTTTPGGLPLFGNAATGPDPGDRPLAPSSAEPLCFHVLLPVAAQSQNVSTTATFNFIAEQTKNN